MKIKSGYLPHKLQNFRQLSPAHPLYVVHTLFPYCEHVATRSTHGFVVVGIIPKYRKILLYADVFTFKLLQRGHTNGIYEANYKNKKSSVIYVVNIHFLFSYFFLTHFMI
jgi:hypothetical protein